MTIPKEVLAAADRFVIPQIEGDLESVEPGHIPHDLAGLAASMSALRIRR